MGLETKISKFKISKLEDGSYLLSSKNVEIKGSLTEKTCHMNINEEGYRSLYKAVINIYEELNNNSKKEYSINKNS